MRLGSKVVTGKTSEVFCWGEDRVVKLFLENYPAEAVEQEYINAHAVKSLEFHKAKEHGIVAYGGRTGIVFERLAGDNLLDVIMKTGKVEEGTEMLCSLHEAILRNEMFDEDIAYYKLMLLDKIKSNQHMTEEEKETLRGEIRRLPDGSQLCHGEFWPRKVIVTEKGAAVIDFGNVCRGPRLFDVAVTYYLLGQFVREECTDKQQQMAEEYLFGMRVMKDEIEPFLAAIEHIL